MRSENKGVRAETETRTKKPTDAKKTTSHPEMKGMKKFGNILGMPRVGKTGENYDRAAMFEPRIKVEICQGSGIPEPLYVANIFVGVEPEPISTKTGWPVLGDRNRNYGLNLSKGYWFAYSYDWTKNRLDLDTVQFKTKEPSVPKKGKTPKYLNAQNSQSGCFTLRVTRAEIKKTEARYSITFPYWGELEEDDFNVTSLYWKWAIQSAEVPVFITEGIKKALLMISQGYPCLALPGVNNIWENSSGAKLLIKSLSALRSENKKIIICFDSDLYTNPDVKSAVYRLGSELEKKTGIVRKNPPAISVMDWPSIHKGVDDLYVNEGESALENVVRSALPLREWFTVHADTSWDNQVLTEEIEGRSGQYYVAIDGELWLYDKNSGKYSICPEAERKINQVLAGVSAPDTGKESKAEMANSLRYVAQISNYIKLARKVNPKTEVNPPGKWCCPDGILSLNIDNTGGEWSVTTDLTPHRPYSGGTEAIVFTTSVDWCLDRSANSDALNELMGFCPENQRDSLLDFIACLLNPKLVRTLLPRTDLPALLMKGEGANGKDSFRKLLFSTLGSERVSSINLAAIKNHDRDDGKFGLNGMDEDTLLNFSSENPSIDLSGCETFKALVTGDPVMAAEKHKAQSPLISHALQIHCTNKDQYLSNAQYAILSRIEVIELPFQFGEREYIDSLPENQRSGWKESKPHLGSAQWIKENCCSALFNEMVSRLTRILNQSDGGSVIDWKACQDAKERIRCNSSHMESFLTTKIEVTSSKDDFIAISDLFKLYADYVEQIDRGIVITDMSSGTCVYTLKEADSKGHGAKYDPIATNERSFTKKLLEATKTTKGRRRIPGSDSRPYVIQGVKIRE